MFLILCRMSDAHNVRWVPTQYIFYRRKVYFKLLRTTFAEKIDHDSAMSYRMDHGVVDNVVAGQAKPVVLLWYQFIKIYIWFPYYFFKKLFTYSHRSRTSNQICERNNNNCNERWRWLSFVDINYVISVQQTFNDNSNLCFCRYYNYYSLHETENDSKDTQTLNGKKDWRICNETKICPFFVIL